MNNIELEKKITQIISDLSNEKGFITAVDVLMKLGYLSKVDYEKWRKGQVTCLERVCQANLNKLTTVTKIIRQVCTKLNFVPSLTVYNKFGKGPKQRLRFSISGNVNAENVYATHFVNRYQIEKLKNKNVAMEADLVDDVDKEEPPLNE